MGIGLWNHRGQQKYPEFANAMHELTVIASILHISEQVAQENNLSQINVINLDVGGMQHLSEEILLHGFDAAKVDTLAVNAELKVSYLPLKLYCNSCNQECEAKSDKIQCQYCDSKDIQIKQGMELNVRSIEGS